MFPPIHGMEASEQTFTGGHGGDDERKQSALPSRARDRRPKWAFRWLGTYDLTATDNGGTRVLLTEVARFKNPLFRVMTRIFGKAKYLDEPLEDLAKNSARPQRFVRHKGRP
ncbi:MAG TPA: hypothetical protein VGI85_12800 [Chthoniobacterales bacterium]|jgi:hypothetical protein